MTAEKYRKLQELRKDIFRETARLAYNNQLKDDIDELPHKFTDNPENKNELTAVKNEILMAIGQNPSAKYDTELSGEVDAALALERVKEPLVTVNKTICQKCRDNGECNIECITQDNSEGLMIESGRCISCGKCIPRCPLEAISDKIEFIPMVQYLKENRPIYANVAPAVVGQFGDDITPGMLRSALKSIGFTDMVEVALFADIITLHEADEYIKNVKTEDDFLITSCCCPVWINMITTHYPDLNARMTKTVSPMIASGRVIKSIFPKAITVFIGPCIAKKSEAKQEDLKGAIDYVLTFNELNEIFKALEINLTEMKDEAKEQSSYGGRIYGRTGGVSKSVKLTVKKVAPEKADKFRATQANGVIECKELLEKLKNNNINANFIEGMGCTGGCVGGPKRNIDIEKGTRAVNSYGETSTATDPVENKNVAYILKHLSTAGKSQQKRLPKKVNLEKIIMRD